MTHSPSLSTHELLEVICLKMGPNLSSSFHIGMYIHAIFLQVLFRHTYCCSIIYVFIEKINQLNTGVFWRIRYCDISWSRCHIKLQWARWFIHLANHYQGIVSMNSLYKIDIGKNLEPDSNWENFQRVPSNTTTDKQIKSKIMIQCSESNAQQTVNGFIKNQQEPTSSIYQ